MSTGGSPKKPKRKSPGPFAAIIYFLTTPIRWWTESRERARIRKMRERSENMPKLSTTQRLFGSIALPFLSLWEAIGGFFQFLGRYLTTRNGLYLLQGIPAILVLLGTFAMGALALSSKQDDLIAHYKTEGEKAVREAKKIEDPKDQKRNDLLDRARLCFERWMQLKENDPEAKFNHAMAAFETKNPFDEETALNEMRQLAPQDKAGGYEGAHKWLAKYYAEQMKAATDPGLQRRARDLAEIHMMRVLILDKDDYNAHRELAQLYLTQYRFDKAEKHLLVAAQLDPGANADLAKLYAVTNQTEKATSYSDQALSYFQSLVERDPDNLEFRIIVAELYVVRKEYGKAIETLEDGIKLKRDDRINKKVAQILLTAMLDIPPENFEERLKFFDKAIAVDPRNEAAFQYIVFYLKQQNPMSQMVQDRIDTALAKYNSPTLHLLLSDFYLKEGKLDLARKHLESVLRIQPEYLPALNNLSHVYAMTKPPDYDRALDIINTCLRFAMEKRLGDDSLAYFYDTRGQIYTMRRQWKEGVEDLEKAIAFGLNQNLQTHTALLRCYQELNKKDLADSEIRLIAKLKEVLNKQGDPAKPAVPLTQ